MQEQLPLIEDLLLYIHLSLPLAYSFVAVLPVVLLDRGRVLLFIPHDDWGRTLQSHTGAPRLTSEHLVLLRVLSSGCLTIMSGPL